MATPTVTLVLDFQAGGPGASMTGANTVVKTSAGFLGTVLDVLTFTDGSAGNWSQGDTKVFVAGGTPTVSSTAVGSAVNPSGATVPVLVTSGDLKVSSS
jgi:hypothetical protein